MAEETEAQVPATEGTETSAAPATKTEVAETPAAPAATEKEVAETPAAPEAPATEKEVAETPATPEAPATKKDVAETPAAPEAKATKKDAAETPAAPAVAETATDEAAPAVDSAAPRRSRGRVIPAGVAHIRATFNNTIVSVADLRGGVISWSSAGRAGFKGSRKSTAFAATVVAQEAARGAVAKGMHEVEVRMQGAGAGRESAVRGLQSAGLNISVIKDVTPIPHNGCRPRKRRRV